MFKEDCTTIVLLQSVYAEMNVAIMNVCIQAVCHSVWLSGSVGSLYTFLVQATSVMLSIKLLVGGLWEKRVMIEECHLCISILTDVPYMDLFYLLSYQGAVDI
jgi:hypothetical protein